MKSETVNGQYQQAEYLRGFQPSNLCYRILQYKPPEKGVKLLEIGCGSGKDAVFLAQSGYDVTAIDCNEKCVEKTISLAEQYNVPIHVFSADLKEFRLDTKFDIIYSNAVLHFMPPGLRQEIFDNYKEYTANQGINIHASYICRSLSKTNFNAKKNVYGWLLGELYLLYQHWQIDYEDIIPDFSGIPLRDAIYILIARKAIP